MSQDDFQVKLLMLGDMSVGKTSVLLRFAEESYRNAYIATIGIDFKVKTVTVDGVRIRLQIWDTAGQERYKSIGASYYRAAMGIFYVFDVTEGKSFDSIQNWLRDSNTDPETSATSAALPVVKIILGNKADLADKRVVEKSTAEKFAKDRGLHYFDVSAKEGTNVNQAFMEMAKNIKKLRLDPLQPNHGGGGSSTASASASAGRHPGVSVTDTHGAQVPRNAEPTKSSGCAC